MHPKHLSISAFQYSLPEHRIAHHPLAERDQSKLLIYQQHDITEDTYRNIASHLPPSSLLVFNNTRVVEARLLFQKSTGGVIELFCLEPGDDTLDIQHAMQQTGHVLWKCLVGGASKWKHGQVLEKILKRADQSPVTLEARYVEKKTGAFMIDFSWSDSQLSFAEILHLAGAIPLPPYIKREVEHADEERYQTIYAKEEGSVAAPTAGLHFTDHIFNELDKKDIDRAFVTLNVGAGTFKPVKSGTMETHNMHAEFIDVPLEVIQALNNQLPRAVIPVGTTSLRTIESLYWFGVLLSQGKQITTGDDTAFPQLGQWIPYEQANDVPVKTALTALMSWMTEKQLQRFVAKTQILIAPGYTFRIASALVTNFHQPESTLLLLVAALVGDDWKRIYTHALENNYRFLSYGDGCLLFRKD